MYEDGQEYTSNRFDLIYQEGFDDAINGLSDCQYKNYDECNTYFDGWNAGQASLNV